MARGANKKMSNGASDYLDNCLEKHEDLGGFTSDVFSNLNVHPGRFEGEAEAREMGASQLSTAGEACADEAIKAWGTMSGAMISKCRKEAVTLPTEAGGPLPQDALMYSETQRTKR